MKKISILLSDDHTVFREGLHILLETGDDMEVIGEAENGYKAVSESKRLLPDVVLMDIAMPLLNGLEATRQITRATRTARVIMLSAYNDDHYLELALQAGAAGYLMKKTTEDHLFEAIRQVHQGNPFFSPQLSRRMVRHWEDTNLNGRPRKIMTNKLTSRQTETLQLIAEGYSTKEIATVLSISAKTVEKHRQAVMDKLDLHEVASLTRYAISSGVVDSNQLSVRPVAHFDARQISSQI
jgi:DNA-binding NarL/FixJ family response regulator